MILTTSDSLYEQHQRLAEKYSQLRAEYDALAARYAELKEEAAAVVQQLFMEQQKLRVALEQQTLEGT